MSGFSAYTLAGPDPNPMTVSEVDILKELIRRLRPQLSVIVNIGAERGTSTLAMLEEVPTAVIFSIDVNPSEGEIENVKKAGLDPTRVVRLLGRSQDIGKAWPYVVHFIWVDGDHRAEAVRGDIRAWMPHLAAGGVIAFHDYFEGTPPPNNPSGAGEAIRELMMTKYELVASYERIRAFKK